MGTTAEKLNYLRETKTEIKNALETPYNVFRDYPELIKKYIDNQPTKTVNDGVCGNAVDFPIKAINIDGNSEQETTDGRQLFDNTLKGYGCYGTIAKTIHTGVRLSVYTDVTNSDYIWGIYAIMNLSDYVGKTVRMKAIIKVNSNLKGRYAIGLCSSSGNNRIAKDNTGSEKEISFVIPNLETGQEYLGVWFYANAGGTGVAGDYVDYTNVIITIDNEDMTYEPYTGGILSPGPDYLQEIEVIDGCNMIDMSTVSKNYYINSVDGSVIRVDNSYNALATDFIEVKEGEKYYFSGMNLFNNGNTGAMYNSKKEFVSGISSDYDIRPITISSGVKYLRLSIWGNKYDVPTNPKPVLAKGTTQKTYLSFGCIGLEQSGINKFDINNIEVESLFNVDYSVNNDKLLIKSINNSVASTRVLNLTLYVEPGTNYRIKINTNIIKFPNSIATGNSFYGIRDESGKWITEAQNIAKPIETVFNSGDKSKLKLSVYLDAKVETLTDNIEMEVSNIMLYEGTGEKSYESYHKSKVIPINLNGNTLSKVGDIKDKLRIYRNGDVEIEKRVGKYVFTGDENVALNPNINGSIFYGNFISDKSANNTEMVCNNFLYESNKTWQQISNYGFCGQKGSNNIFIRNDDYTNLVDFKAYLRQQYNAGTPAHIFYELSEPQTIKLPSISPIELWQGTNIFKLITNLDTTFEVEYVVDKESILNEVQTAMLEAEIEI